MKTMFLSITIFFLSLSLYAQPRDYNGPAKITVKAFWDGAAKLEKSIAGGGSSLDAKNNVVMGSQEMLCANVK